MVGTDRSTGRAGLTPREQAVGTAFGLWMVIGLFLDGWAHDNDKPESFFTPWHGILYSGFTAAALAAVAVAFGRRRADRSWTATLPRGHGLTLVALVGFAAGAIGDLAWHETLGVEVGVEALLSPTHLLLLASGLVALSAPLRSAWVEDDARPDGLRDFAPVAVSTAILVSLVGFFLLYLSPFVNDAAGTRFDRVASEPHDHPSTEVGELQQMLGIGSILMTTVLIVVPIALLRRRWQPPMGSFALLLGIVITLFVGLNEFAQPGLLPAGVFAGVAADLMVRNGHGRLAGVAATLTLWIAYFGLYQSTVDTVAWSAELWSGTIVLASLVAGAIGLLELPVPAHSRGARPATQRAPDGAASQERNVLV